MLNNSLIVSHEAGGDPACVSNACGGGDLGGISYGIYQFSSAKGAVQPFIDWLCNYPNPAYANYGNALNQYTINSADFIAEWKEIGTVDQIGFAALQNEYAGDKYYNSAAALLADHEYDLSKHTEAMQAVLFSRSVQYNAGNMPELYKEAVQRLGFANLSYVDDASFDAKMIGAIYDFLIEECDNAYQLSNGMYHSPKDWCNGSYTVVKVGLHDRFVNEKAEALALL